MTDARLARQIAFLLEIDGLKSVLRQSHLIDLSRRENDAEHSWHLAMLAVVLGEYATEEVDQAKVIRMLLIHDLVEVYAGDTFLYDTRGVAEQEERERAAADRLFPQLPDDQAVALRRLWDEFEERRTPDARFARALDRVQPLLLNFYTRGASWRAHRVTKAQVLARRQLIEDGSPALWEYIQVMIDEAVRRGYLLP
ncbi:putative HD superfamily hydrolase [Frankia canadensis]|uniref:Putative HD superfamily hydrolase n=1 Tax=Frankia canadensis TaxID=1836972 RepID=A0A2I2KJV1_9ACTN|nr:HD domain-containing protein [Frankia canadensis]SNQ45949.1 putative HD superfamily hydrolase [Frankia canadensis]SOU53239.1 putative HD superfamily hydrolase [Frankia canadensis]